MLFYILEKRENGSLFSKSIAVYRYIVCISFQKNKEVKLFMYAIDAKISNVTSTLSIHFLSITANQHNILIGIYL